MRITKEVLLDLAQEAVEQQAAANKQFIAAYLHGSLLGDEALLAESTDIDLTFVYRKGFAPENASEFIRISPEIHLDVLHHDEGIYKPPRNLRGQPWLGYAVYDFKILHDPRHVLDFVQAGVRNSFFEPEIVLERASCFYSSARNIWSRESVNNGIDLIFSSDQLYKALGYALNSILSLNGPPLPLRRLIANLPQRMADINDDGLLAGFLGLTGLTNLDDVDLDAPLLAWHEVYPVAARENEKLPLFRLAYYRNSIQHWLDSGNKPAAVWILVNTWMEAVLSLSGEETDKYRMPLEQFLGSLGLNEQILTERWAGLDLYLDKIEELFENWKEDKGI